VVIFNLNSVKKKRYLWKQEHILTYGDVEVQPGFLCNHLREEQNDYFSVMVITPVSGCL
jgi:hypothetical protein